VAQGDGREQPPPDPLALERRSDIEAPEDQYPRIPRLGVCVSDGLTIALGDEEGAVGCVELPG
jgi:hypothetical protein